MDGGNAGERIGRTDGKGEMAVVGSRVIWKGGLGVN